MKSGSRPFKEEYALIGNEVTIYEADLPLLITHRQLSFEKGRTGTDLLDRVLFKGRTEHIISILSHPKLTLTFPYLERIVKKDDPICLQAVLPLYQPYPEMIYQALYLGIEKYSEQVVNVVIQFILALEPHNYSVYHDPMVAALKYRVKLVPRLLSLNLFRKNFDYATVTKAKTKQVFINMIKQAQ